MATVLVNYTLPQILPRLEVMKLFEKSIEIFSGMDGLHSKQFCYDEKTGKGLSVYHWNSIEQAEAFFSPIFLKNFEAKFGAVPSYEIFDTLLLVDNRVGDTLTHN